MQRVDALKWIAVAVICAAGGFGLARWIGPGVVAAATATRHRTSDLREDGTGVPDAASPEPAAAASTPAATSLSAVRIESSGDDGAVSEELAPLRDRIAELEAEVERLRRELEGKDLKHRQLAQFFAANDLKHADLYRELVERFVAEPESVAEDPREACSLLVRAIDESGLSGAPRVVDSGGPGNVQYLRSIEPEPAAPELSLNLDFNESGGIVRDDAGREQPRHTDYVELNVNLALPKAPEGWLGRPLAVHIRLHIQRGMPQEEFLLEANDPSSGQPSALKVWVVWNDEQSVISRTPWNGDSDDRQLGPDEFPELRRLSQEVFVKLRSRAR
jgi:hypothetical protein